MLNTLAQTGLNLQENLSCQRRARCERPAHKTRAASQHTKSWFLGAAPLRICEIKPDYA